MNKAKQNQRKNKQNTHLYNNDTDTLHNYVI